MANPEDLGRRQQIQDSLKSIVESSDKSLGDLRKREARVRLASSIFTAILGALVVGAGVMAFFVVQGHLYTYFQGPNQPMSGAPPELTRAFGTAGGSAIAAGLICGFGTYFLLKRKHGAGLKEISSLIMEMKKKIGENQQAQKNTSVDSANNTGAGKGITVDALSLADKIMALLPEIVRKRNQDSLLFGAIAFVIAAIVGHNAAIAILVGAIVWLYFRYETKKKYEQEIAKLEDQKKLFEQRKREFLETL
jgi:multisubunit Na+/H+ antiporter MnhC subunit